MHYIESWWKNYVGHTQFGNNTALLHVCMYMCVQTTYDMSHTKVNIRQAYIGNKYGQSTDMCMGVVDVTYAYILLK